MADKGKTGSKSSGKAKGQKAASKPDEKATPTAPDASADAPPAEAPATAPAEPAFSPEDWVRYGKSVLGHKPRVVIAALAGQDPEARLTRAQVDKLVRTALNTPA